MSTILDMQFVQFCKYVAAAAAAVQIYLSSQVYLGRENSDQNFSRAFVTFLFEGGERQNAGFHNFGKAFTSLHKQTFSRNTNVIINTTACIASTFAAAAKKVKGK